MCSLPGALISAAGACEEELSDILLNLKVVSLQEEGRKEHSTGSLVSSFNTATCSVFIEKVLAAVGCVGTFE